MSLQVLKLELGTLKKEKEKKKKKCILLLLNGKENLASRVRYFSVDPPIHGYSLEHH